MQQAQAQNLAQDAEHRSTCTAASAYGSECLSVSVSVCVRRWLRARAGMRWLEGEGGGAAEGGGREEWRGVQLMAICQWLLQLELP